MKTINILGFLIAITLSGVSFYATSNIFVGSGVLLVTFLFYFLLVSKKIHKHKITVSKLHECYLFINNFLVSLSIKESLNSAFEVTSNAISDEFKDYLGGIEELNPQEKLVYLNKYFPFHIYKVFIDTILLWLDEGGQILDMSNQITNEMRQIEEYITFSESVNRRKIVEIVILWLFSLTIIVALKIALQSFYQGLLNNPVFIISIVIYVLVILISIYLLTQKITRIEIRGIENE